MSTQEWLNRCFNCMAPLHDPQERCSVCGWDNRRRVNGEGRLEQMMLKGQYLVGRALGRGGFGVTYMGFDLNLNRRVAIKEYFPLSMAYRHTDQTTVRPYENAVDDYADGLRHAHDEGQTAAKLGHIPNIVQVYNAFPENGTVYIVMEYIEGTTLAQMVKEHGRMPWQRALELLYPIMRALEKAHAKRIIHRDISPDNIMLSRETGETVLLDFGAAREAKAGLTAVLRPGYAPLEQYSEQTAQDGRVDEYALCATMYYLVTGTVPESSDLRAYVKRPLKSPRALGCDIPSKVEAVLMKGMSLQAADRYESMAALRHAFEQAADRERKQSVSRKGLIALLVALALVVTGVLGWMLHNPPIGEVEAPVIHVGGQAPEQGKVLTLTVEADEASVPIEWSAEGDVQGYSVRVSDGTGEAVTEMDFRGGKSCNIDSGDLETGIVYTVEVGVIPTGGSVKNAVWGRERFILVKAETAQEEAPTPEPEAPEPEPETESESEPETPTPEPETPEPEPETESEPEPETESEPEPETESEPEPETPTPEPETQTEAPTEEKPSGYYVYATPKGTYYHVNSTCSGMQNAQQVLLSDMLKENRPACPMCCPNAEATVFAEPGNPYYHSYATCSGMTKATQGILVNALVAGLTRCPVCWTADGQAASGAEAGADGDGTSESEATYATLKKGSKGDEVVRLKARLYELDYMTERSTSTVFGKKTEAAVKLFQQTVGMEATGIADDETQRQLYAEDAPHAEAAQPTPKSTLTLKEKPTSKPTPEPVAEVSAPEITVDPVFSEADGIAYIKGDITIRWTCEGDVEEYQVSVTDSDGNLLASTRTSDEQISARPALSSGEVYTIAVTAVPRNGTLEADGVSGTVRVALYVEPTPEPTPKPTPEPTPEVSLEEAMAEARAHGESWTIASGDYHTVILKQDGTVISVGNSMGEQDTSDWTDIVAVAEGHSHTVGLKRDGTVVAVGKNENGQCDVSDWTDIVAVTAGDRHTVGLRRDGTVVATEYKGNYYYNQCDVGDWTDIVAVSAGDEYTVGLKRDGTVIAVGGRNLGGECDVGDWTDIVAVAAGSYHTVGLRADGTVVATKYTGSSYYHGECEVYDWRDIVAVAASTDHTVGLKRDGTVVVTKYQGDDYRGQCEVSDWTDIVSIAATYETTIGLKRDGTVIAVGKDGFVGRWTDINISDTAITQESTTTGNATALKVEQLALLEEAASVTHAHSEAWTIGAGGYFTVALRQDGTVAAAGSNTYAQCVVDTWTDIVAVAAGEFNTIGLKRDGTVVAAGLNSYGQCNVSGWTDIVAVSAGENHTVGLKRDGTVVATGYNNAGQCDVDNWSDIVAVSVGRGQTVGLRSDGTVVATGYNGFGQCEVSNWSDIVAISAGSFHTLGLKRDGTVVSTTLIDNDPNDDRSIPDYGQCNVSGWTDIVAVATCDYHTVGLKRDGTVVATGDNEYGQCDVGDWTDIVAVSTGYTHTVGLKRDGTVVAVGYNEDGRCDVGDWTDIMVPDEGITEDVGEMTEPTPEPTPEVSLEEAMAEARAHSEAWTISAGNAHTVGLKRDGTVVAVGGNGGGQCDVSDWTDIVAVSAGNWHTVGLKRDDTVVAIGNNEYGQCDVGGWTDIVAVSAEYLYTIGLKRDGTVVAVGANYSGRCDVNDWTDIVAVSAGSDHTVGLKRDGTVVATHVTDEGNNYGQSAVSDWTDIVAISAGKYHTVGLKRDGTVVATRVTDEGNNYGQSAVSDWTDIVAVSAGEYHTVGLKRDGTVVATHVTDGGHNYGQSAVSDWTDIVVPDEVATVDNDDMPTPEPSPEVSLEEAMAEARAHSEAWMIDTNELCTIALKRDGTVLAVGNWDKQLQDVKNWTDIVAVSVGYSHAVGLKRDGTVVATETTKSQLGTHYGGECDVSDWTDIVAVSARGGYTLGLKRDGTVVATNPCKYPLSQQSYIYIYCGQCDVSDWTDIVAVSAGTKYAVGLKRDGTVVAVGGSGGSLCDVSDWTDIVAVSAGESHTVGLKRDGTVVAVGSNIRGQCDVSDWTDIVAVSAGDYHTVGLKRDGTVVSTGYQGDKAYDCGQCDVDGWKDIVAISASPNYSFHAHTVGVKSNGTLVAKGSNWQGQCNVGNWKNILTPDMEPGTLRRGDKGDAVTQLQQMLKDLGYLSGAVDGDFGKGTEESVKAAQKAFGMEETGIATLELQSRLKSEHG